MDFFLPIIGVAKVCYRYYFQANVKSSVFCFSTLIKRKKILEVEVELTILYIFIVCVRL